MVLRIRAVFGVILALWALIPHPLHGAAFTINSVGVMDPNPYGLTILENTVNANVNTDPLAGPLPGGTGLSLASFQSLMHGDNGAFARDNGGVLDAQQIWQGGSWPANAGGNNIGATMGDTFANPITATYGATQANSIQFWREVGAVVPNTGIDSNINNGNQVVSGGGRSPTGGGSGSVNFATGIFNDNTETGSVVSGGGYIGIQGTATFSLVFNGPAGTPAAPVSNVTAFGITQVPRNAARTFQIVATFSDATTFDSGLISYTGTTTSNFFGVSAPAGQTITQVLVSDAGTGFTRFDDMAFITSAPSDVGGWQSATPGSWATSGNWATGVVPNAVGAAASFRGALGTSGNITLDGNKTVGQIIFVNAAASYNVVPGTGGSLTIDNTGGFGATALAADAGTHSINVPVTLANPTTQIYIDNDARLTIGGNISDAGASSIVKFGNGLVTLSGNNTYLGTTTINLGTLNAAKPSSLPGYDAAGRVLVNAGGALAVSVGGLGQWQSADIDALLANATFATHQVITPSRLGFDTTGGNFTYGSIIAGNQGIDKIGPNTLVLTGVNTYTGPTRILGGTLSVASISENLGMPVTTNADSYSAVLSVGSGSTGGTFLYTGAGETTNRILDMTGTTGGATIDQSGTGPLIFGTTNGITLATSRASVTASGNGNKTLTLQGSTAGTGEIQGIIINHQTTGNEFSPAALTSVVKSGTGTWTLSGVNAYTGTTTINQGRLALGVAGAINTTSQLTLAGGTFATGGVVQSLAVAPLALSASSTIDMGVGFSTLNFANSGGLWTAGTVLTIDNWSGTPITGSGTDQIIFGLDNTGLSAAQVSQIKFSGFAPGAAITANGEVVPTSAPYLVGDITRDGHVNAADITAMINELKDINAYQAAHPTLTLGDVAYISDLNADGQFNNADLQGLLDYLIQGHGSANAVPEPSAWLLLTVGGLSLLVRHRRRFSRRCVFAGHPDFTRTNSNASSLC